MVKKNECPNCHLQIEGNEKVCRFCGADLTQEVAPTVHEHKKDDLDAKEKIVMPLHFWIYLGVFGASLLMFILLLLPALSTEEGAMSGYKIIFGSNLQIGANVPTIVFIFSIVGSLNLVAVLRSVQKKSTEIALFSYFTMFYYLVIVIMSFCSAPLCSRGSNVPTYSIQIGMILTGIFAILLIFATGVATFFYKRYLVSNPLERAKI